MKSLSIKENKLGLLFSGIVFALVVRFLFIEDYRVVSSSMSPSLLTGDLVVVYKWSFNLRFPFSNYEIIRWRAPARGEVVAFSLPERAMETFVKRVIAIEKDKVEVKEDKLWVNGEAILNLSHGSKNYGPIEIPKDHFFALGDNFEDSQDSRVWGPIPYSCLKGRVGLVWLSIDPEGHLRTQRLGTRI